MERKRTEEYLEDYLEDCILRKRLNQKTIRAYKIDLKQYFDFIGSSNDDLKKINEYIHFLNRKYSKYKTVKRKIASIKAFYSYLEYEEIISFSPFIKIRTQIKEPKMLPRIIQKEYLNLIFQYLSNDLNTANTEYKKKLAVRNIAAIELLFSTGIRISELCNIRLKDIDFHDRSLKIFGKGSKERILYLGSDQVITSLKKYLEFNNIDDENSYLFLSKFNTRLSEQSIRILLKNIENELKLSVHITPHMFRHTFATTLLEKEVDIRYIQNILGHSSISTTQIYTHVTYPKQKEILINKNPMNDFQESV
ncbi:tyrosine-type recombinase/integrase [Thomasclavelia cocleata]|uniref:tyrosine-type recombinase/integrase n=1 Tax=Thomasclavelia cocleata TaxID=69824 RepID=UPI00242D091C|nr:tyrosine-type recombinase/integrase [Thomasclavelia cocleata]